MHGRNPVSTRLIAVTLAATVLIGGCRDSATTGPTLLNTADYASAIRTVQGDQQTGAVGAALTTPIRVKVVDAGGMVVQGATVVFQVRAGGGSVNPPAGSSGADGMVTAIWTLGSTIGANKMVAVLSNNFVVDSIAFTATAIAGPPSTVTLVSGNNQSGRVGKPLAQPLVVKVLDQMGFAKSGVTVTWLAGTFSGSVVAVKDTTSADGTASATWTLGTFTAIQTASAAVSGLTPIVFTAGSIADTARVVTVVSGNGQNGAVSTGLPLALKLKLADQYGNPVAGEAISWIDSISAGTSVSSGSGNTAADGTLQTNWTMGSRVGQMTLRAKHAASGSTVTFTSNATVAFSDVFAGNFFACGIAASNNQAYCWGSGDAGQLGKGTLRNTSAPTTPVSTSPDTAVGPFLQFRQLSGGRNSLCGLSTARQLYCWGRVPGQSAVVNNVATFQAILLPPQQLLPNLIAVGLEHYCLTDLSGIGFCTGVNLHGQLGDGTNTTPTVGTFPWIVPAPGAVGSRHYSNLVSGAQHTCGMPRFDPAAPSLSQTPVCWGLNTAGQVGNSTVSGGNIDNVNTPAPITLPAGVTGFDSTSITAGLQHTCAIASAPALAAGVAYCWGGNGFGQLGSGTPGSGVRDSIATAVTMPAGVTFVRIAAGENHTCAISTTGDVYCWGRNDQGQLGDGTRVNSVTPVLVGGGQKFRSISLGELYTCGAVGPLTTGATIGVNAGPAPIFCWGDNTFGQIGNNQAVGVNNGPMLTPTRVAFQP